MRLLTSLELSTLTLKGTRTLPVWRWRLNFLDFTSFQLLLKTCYMMIMVECDFISPAFWQLRLSISWTVSKTSTQHVYSFRHRVWNVDQDYGYVLVYTSTQGNDDCIFFVQGSMLLTLCIVTWLMLVVYCLYWMCKTLGTRVVSFPFVVVLRKLIIYGLQEFEETSQAMV